MKIKPSALLPIGLTVAVAVVVGVTLRLNHWRGERTYSDVDWRAAATLPMLIEKSPVIVQGVLRDERTESRSLVSPVTGEVAGERTELVRTFELTHVFRGSFAEGNLLDVRTATTIRTWEHTPSESHSFSVEPAPTKRGGEYVLFLTRFSDETCDELGPVGVVSVAEVQGSQLTFLAPEAYLRELARAPMDDRGRTGLGASFDVTAARLAELVVALPQRTVDPPAAPAVIDANTRNGQIAFDLAASDEQFRDGPELVRRLEALGFSTDSFDAQACYKIQTVLAEAKKVTVDLGCP